MLLDRQNSDKCLGQVTSLRQLLQQKRTAVMNSLYRNCNTLENVDIDEQFRRSISEKLLHVYYSSELLQSYASTLEQHKPSEQLFIQRELESNYVGHDQQEQDENQHVGVACKNTGLVEGVKRYQQQEVEVCKLLKQLEKEVIRMVMQSECEGKGGRLMDLDCYIGLNEVESDDLNRETASFLNNTSFEDQTYLRPRRRGWALNPSGGIQQEKQYSYLHSTAASYTSKFIACACSKCPACN
eukprot:TRINITY_DN9219_c0_g1_i12.p1 TRINITY_DN9219_c0_g1~~TRINITY_DN9219_c0_g1_i12.p1  ORF type:complete len:267 (+),score=33.65 TRINITY_DN9219_c0_g1_i12:79-801(+)